MKSIYKAIAMFQQECPVIHKDTEGYGYNYADLPQILETVNPLLKKHGLGFTQLANGTQLKTIVFHVESGESIESNTDIPQGVELAKMNTFQVLGSAISYIRRYALSSILGIVTDKDTDAAPPKQKPAHTSQQPSYPQPATSNDVRRELISELNNVNDADSFSALINKRENWKANRTEAEGNLFKAKQKELGLQWDAINKRFI